MCRLVSALALITGALPLIEAACNSTTCSECTESECSNTAGCFDDSPGDYDPAYCVSSEGGGDDEAVGGDVASLLMGLFGGVFFCVLPCGLMCRRRGNEDAKTMMSGPPATRRTNAKVNKKWTKTSSDGEGGTSTSYHISTDFVATDASNAQFKVSGERLVYRKTYEQAQEGGQLEVVYRSANMAGFEFTSDLECRLQGSTASCILFVFIGIFGVVGLAVGVASGPVTENYLGVGVFAVMALAAPILGYILWPMAMKMKRTGIKVTPVAATGTVIGSS